jgi:hypothetical protein
MPKGGKMNARRLRPVAFAVLTLVTVVTAAALPRYAGAADGAWLGEYYANPWLMGPAALIREDGNINFDWGDGSPAQQIPDDSFSVRWTRTLPLDAGRYRFTVETDDGVRLFLDGALIIDQWHDQAATAYNAERDLGAGQHSLRMEYFENAGGALARLSWTRTDAPPPQGAWRGEYFANRWLSGPPVLVRDDPEINFDWGDGSPASQIPDDNFSVRWTRSLRFDAGRYRFTTTTDDGVRLYLDGQLIIDEWQDQAATAYNAERDLGAGQHSLRMEYYENAGGAVARLSWKRVDGPPPPPQGAWRGEYFANPSLSGSPALVRDDAAINFDWGDGSPAGQIPADNFSVRWSRSVTFDAGRYRFTATTDDGVRLYLDGQLIIDQWRVQAAATTSAERDLGAGQHSLRMEYFEAAGKAVARLSWERAGGQPPPPQGAWRGEYFANRSLSGSPVLVRDDAEINFDWGGGSPAWQIPPDNFSVRWTRSLQFEAGRYRFTTTTDDGVRLYLDGKLIIDQWRDQAPATFTAERDLSAGQHTLRMDYYEAAGGAVARLSWTRIGGPAQGPWRGEYFANRSLAGSPALVRDDPEINFDWGAGSPAPQIPPDDFSVRWTRTINLSGGRYRFSPTTDDGVRLYVDGRMVMQRWMDMAPTTFNVYLDLASGDHTVRMEYYEHTGNALARLSIDKVASEKPVPVGNIVTCARPGNSWIRIYRLDGNSWTDTNPNGYGPIGSSGWLKLDGFMVDTARYGGAGHPYRVEVWTNGVRVHSVGNTAAGEAPFRVRAYADNYTPWGCS